MMTQEREVELIDQVQQGNCGAFSEIFDSHHRRVVHIALQMVRDEETALDVAQEVFIRAYQELDGWRGEARLGSWLYRTTVLVCFEHLRIEQKQVRLRAKVQRPMETEISPEHHAETNERDALVRRAISVLPPRQRAIVILKQFKALRFSEIASLLGITEGGAKANYHRALISLRQNMQQVLAEVA